ncbi:hypothetical protein L0F63_000561 [Massospora cicadina]|nr:hypothetical protein L0F63_000561 [Massospora cicadina]
MDIGLFDELSFNFGSDSECEAIDVHLLEEEKRKEREEFFRRCKEFRPFGGEKKWFFLADNETVADRIRVRRNAGSEIKHLMEYHYLRRNYRCVVELGSDFLKVLSQTKVNNPKELVEILIRAQLQLGEYSESLRWVEGWKLAKGASEPGQLFLKAQVFSLAGNLNGKSFTLRLWSYCLFF